jgi:hypothetical protein
MAFWAARDHPPGGAAGHGATTVRPTRAGGRAGGVGAATLHRMTSRSPGALPALLALALVLAGCGGDDEAASPTTSAPASSSAADGTATGDGAGEDGDSGEAPPDTGDDGDDSAPPFPANTEPDTGEASADALLSVTDIRIGRHEGFDRVVFEADGTGTPGWDVRYVDAAQSQGSGADIAVEGDAVLQVTITGVGIPADTGVEEYSGPDRLSSGDAEVVTEVVFDSTFEGQTVSFVGVTEETPFRAYLLEDPARVVLEVADPG